MKTKQILKMHLTNAHKTIIIKSAFELPASLKSNSKKLLMK